MSYSNAVLLVLRIEITSLYMQKTVSASLRTPNEGERTKNSRLNFFGLPERIRPAVHRQFSTTSPLTRWNSPTLLVTTINPRASPQPAIRVS